MKVLAAAVLVVLVASVSLGEYAVAPLDVLRALGGAGDGATSFVVLDLRLPRAVTGALAGAALGAAGAVFQGVTRNPLVAPDIVGVAGGASLAAVALIVFGGGEGVPLAALAGALAAGAGLYGLAWRHGVHGQRLVLVGIGVAAFAQAGVAYVLVRGRIFEVSEAFVWLVGSLNGRGWEQAWPLAAGLAVALPLLLLLGRAGRVLALGDELARALGVGVERTRLALLGLAVVLTALAVSAVGAVGFVAFVAPHLARRAVDGSLVAAAACGALLVLLADLAGRLAFPPHEIPVGIVTSVLAAPYFLWLLRSRPTI
ncbi:MAG TPA: iron ABC transporter permease [Solirubrobacter sp.]|nr:iron ABC transporter permease [Solirubrobacter sp.]